jgi:hypothetical protein
MDYWKNLKDTLKTTWEHKYLWGLGIILAIFGGSGSGSGGSNSSGNSGGSSNINGSDSVAFNKVTDFVTSVPLGVWILIGVLILILIILLELLGIYLASRSKAGLIASTKEIESGKRLSFGKSWKLGAETMKGLFKQNLMIAIPGFVILLMVLIGGLVYLSTLYSEESANNLITNSMLLPVFAICAGTFICSYLILFLLFYVAQAFGSKISVLEGKDAILSLKAGFAFFWRNFVELFISWLVSLLVGFVYVIVELAIFIPMMFLMTGLFIVGNPITTIIAILILLVFIALALFISGPVTAFTEVYWTKVYLRIKELRK